MKKRSPLVLLALVVFTLAWFLPVVRQGKTLGDGVLPGWEAFSAALDLNGDDWASGSGVISRISALTNFLMLGSVALLLRRDSAKPPAWMPLAFGVATLINLWWVTSGDRADLRIGYWLWMGSFALMAVALSVARAQQKVTA